jgi:hypothetical protein
VPVRASYRQVVFGYHAGCVLNQMVNRSGRRIGEYPGLAPHGSYNAEMLGTLRDYQEPSRVLLPAREASQQELLDFFR